MRYVSRAEHRSRPAGQRDLPSAAQMAAAAGRIRGCKRIDRAAVAIITLGGIAVVVSVIGILVFIAAEAVPLFRSASSAHRCGTIRLARRRRRSAGAHALGADEYAPRIVYIVEPTGALAFYQRRTPARGSPTVPSPASPARTVTASSRSLSVTTWPSAPATAASRSLQVHFTPVYEGRRPARTSTVDVARARRRRTGRRAAGRSDASLTSRTAIASSSPRRSSDTEIGVWWTDGDEERHQATAADGRRMSRPSRSAAPARSSPAPTAARCTTGSSATRRVLTDVSTRRSSPDHARWRYVVGNRTFVAGTADGHVSAGSARRSAPTSPGAWCARSSSSRRARADHRDRARRRRDRTFATGGADGRSCCATRPPGARCSRCDGTARRSRTWC